MHAVPYRKLPLSAPGAHRARPPRGRGGGEGPLGGRRCVERLWLAALALRAAAIHVPAAASALPVAGTELRALTGSMELP